VAAAAAAGAVAAAEATASAEVRREELIVLKRDVDSCTRCALAEGRTQTVFGAGNADAELMFVGEAPGFHEDQQGLPFVGAAGKLLEQLLTDIGMSRQDVFIANVLKCRPPGNRDPLPEEIASCEPHLFRQLQLIRPTVVATLGNFATKLLSGNPTGITRVHGVEQHVTIGSHPVVLFPLYHPAAALYTRAMLSVLEEDFGKLPAILATARGEAAPPPPSAPAPRERVEEAQPVEAPGPGPVAAEQLGLF
jgi:uracil-DNA glycosylase family 4